MTEPNVDVLWYELQPTVAGLQAADRLPPAGYLYDARLEVVKDYLRSALPLAAAGKGSAGLDQALAEAGRISKHARAAGFLAFELIKVYCSAVGDRRSEARAARRATDALHKAEKDWAKQQQRWRRRDG